jgi:cytochrome bd-type quinol oxidase subunit 2
MTQPTPQRRSPAVWVTATVLIVVAIALPLIVPIYARTTPKWGAFPFFYWYQLILVPVIAILCASCYLLLRKKPARGAGAASGNGEVAR